jgi:hypothetical protein
VGVELRSLNLALSFFGAMGEPEPGRVERNLTCETFRRHWTSMFKIHVENLKGLQFGWVWGIRIW